MENRTLAALLVVGGLGVLASFMRRQSKVPLPPGPPKDPLIGHLRIMPREKQAEAFHEWAKVYGDLMYLEVPGRKLLVIDSYTVARDLLDYRGANYSSRPWFVVWEVMGWTSSLPFMSYGKDFLKHRRMLRQFFGKKESAAFKDVLMEEARLLVKNMHETQSGDLLKYVHRLTVSNIMRVTYGHPVKSDDDILMHYAHVMQDTNNNAGPIGNTPVDLLPWLRHFPSWFPGTYYFHLAKDRWSSKVREVYDVTVELTRSKMTGNFERSFVSDKLQELEEVDEDETFEEVFHLEDIKGAAATIFTAGQETSFENAKAFMLAMATNPDIQKRAYEEIISVVGEDRLPDLHDRDSLPYVECILKETSRWHVSLPVGVPHRVDEDDIYNGMFIPKGTVVIPNIRGMSRDERVYKDPYTFNPSRYLPAPEGREEPKFNAVWGFGRRICLGRHFADLQLWHAIAYTLATTEILPITDEKGNIAAPSLTTTEGFTSGLQSFNFSVRPRSEKARVLIRDLELTT